MKKAIFVRHETLKEQGIKKLVLCRYYLNQEDWGNGLIPLPTTTLVLTYRFDWKTWWRLQKQVIAKRLLESAK